MEAFPLVASQMCKYLRTLQDAPIRRVTVVRQAHNLEENQEFDSPAYCYKSVWEERVLGRRRTICPWYNGARSLARKPVCTGLIDQEMGQSHYLEMRRLIE